MGLKQATRTTLTQEILEQMEHLIQSGEWAVGSRIPPEPELVRQLGVSRNTVREAVKALIHAGMLEARQGDGTYVCSDSGLGTALQRRFRRSDLIETLEVRNALEQEAARLAAERHTDADAERLWNRLKECHEALDLESYIAADVELHREIFRITGNRLYMELFEHLTEALHATILSFSRERKPLLQEDIHDDLIRHILERDAEAAAADVRKHIEKSRLWIQSHS